VNAVRFPEHGSSVTIAQVLDDKTGRPHTGATALQGERSRARKGADGRILAREAGSA